MGKQWKSDRHLEEKWLESSWEGFAFTAYQLRPFISSNRIKCAWFIHLSTKTEGCLTQGSGDRRTHEYVTSQRLCSHCTLTELQQIKCWLLVLYLNFAAYILLIAGTYTQIPVPMVLKRYPLFLNIFLWEERTTPQKGEKSNNLMRRAEEEWFTHTPEQISDGIRR